MDRLTPFGLVAVSLMLVFYALEARGPASTSLLAAAYALGSTSGVLQGTGPFGLVEAVWTVVALAKRRDRVGG